MLPDSGWGAERVQRARQQEKAQTDVLTPNVSATGFPNLSIDKAIGMSGMRLPVSGSGDPRQEHRVQISDICLNASTAESVVAQIRLVVSNPSVIQLGPLGQMRLRVQYAGVALGVFVVQAWDTVRRGENSVLVQGTLDVAPRDLVPASDLFSALLAGRPVTLLSALEASNSPLVAAALDDVPLSTWVSMPALPLLRAWDGLTIVSCSLVPMCRSVDGSRRRSAACVSQAGVSEVRLEVRVRVGINQLLGPEGLMKVMSLAAPDVALGYGGNAVATLALPTLALPEDEQGATTLDMSVAAVARVQDDGFGTFVREFMQADEVKVVLNASLSANVSTAMGTLGLVGVPISQPLRLPAAGDLRDVRVLEFDVSEGSGGMLEVWIKAQVWNPSSLSATLGAVTFEIKFDGELLGNVATPNLVVMPGPNIIECSGALMPVGSAAVAALGQLVATYLRGDVVKTSVRGLTASTFDAPWLQSAISALNLEVPLQLPKRDPLLQDIEVDRMAVRFGGSEHTGGPLLSAQIRARLALPFSVRLDVTSADLSLFISGGLVGHTAGQAFAFVGCNGVDIECDGVSGQVNITLSDAPLRVLDEAALDEFVRAQFQEALVMLSVEGNVSVTAAMQFGGIRLRDVPVTSSLVVRGMAGLNTPPVEVSGVQVYPAHSPIELPVSMTVGIFNPSDLDIALGDVTFVLFVTDCMTATAAEVASFGEVSLAGVVLRQGWNRFPANGTFSASRVSESCGEEFLSNYVNGRASNVTLRGGWSRVPVIQSLLRAFETSIKTPGLANALVSEVNILMLDPLPVLESRVLHVTVTLINPTEATAELLSLALALQFKDASGRLHTLGDYQQDLSDSPIVLPARSTVTTGGLCVKLSKVLSPLLIKAFLEASTSVSGAPIWVQGPARARLGDKVLVHLDLQQGPAFAKVRWQTPPACWPALSAARHLHALPPRVL